MEQKTIADMTELELLRAKCDLLRQIMVVNANLQAVDAELVKKETLEE